MPKYKAYFKEKSGEAFPDDPMEQLWGAIGAVFGSWMAEKAVTYRRVEKITGLLGTAVNVVQMVFGNTGDNSGTGVCFTRDPSTGEKIFYGDYLTNAQGEDVVAGIRTPVHLTELKKIMPKAYAQLEKVRVKLEGHYKDMQDMEFTIEEGKLYMLQTRTGKRTPAAAFKIAMDMANEKLINKEEAVLRIKPEDIERLFYPVIDSKVDKKALSSKILAHGIDAVPGAAVGKVVLLRSGSRRVGQAWREGDPGSPRDEPRRRGRHGRCAGHSDGDGWQDFARRGGCARVGQVLHRRRGDLGH